MEVWGYLSDEKRFFLNWKKGKNQSNDKETAGEGLIFHRKLPVFIKKEIIKTREKIEAEVGLCHKEINVVKVG